MIAYQQIMKKSMNSDNPEADMNFISLGFDSLKRFPGFREKTRNVNAAVRNIWSTVISKARKNGEIGASMDDDQIANQFMYISEGVAIHLTLEGRASEIAHETLRLWDGFYNLIKRHK